MKLLTSLFLAAAASAPLPAQSVYVPVNAPYAQNLLIETKKAHPELQKLGLHVIPPGQQDYAIIANPIPSKIGKKSSADDLTVVTSGKPFAKPDDKGKFFDLRLPISDSSGNPIGLTVMEIPYNAAADLNDSLAKATAIRDEIQKKIPGHDQLFQATDEPMTVMPSIPFGASIKGHFDHFGVDVKHNRLFATAEDSHAVVVFDLVNGTVLKEIQGIPRPHAILYREDLNHIYVTDGDGSLKIFDGESYDLIGMVPLQKDADSIGYDPSGKYLYIDNGGKDAGNKFSFVTSVDTSSSTKVSDIRVDSDTLEAMAVDAWRPRLYVNDPAQNQVRVIDRVKKTVIASWPLTMCKDNVAMGLDEQHQRLFVGCRSGQIVVIDSNTGKELQTLSITKGVDDLEFDPASQRLYAVAAGMVDVFQEADADHYRSLGTISVGGGAKTGRLVPAINRYFAAVPASSDNAASVAVLQPMNNLAPKTAASTEVPQTVSAPRALKLDLATMSAHPYLRKMGLHAIPPGGKDSVIIANANTARIGFKSSQGDLDAVKDGKTYCVKRDDGSFFNAKLPLKDASGKIVGILVMEIPFSTAPTEEEAIQQAEDIRQELAQKIPDYQWLFQN